MKWVMIYMKAFGGEKERETEVECEGLRWGAWLEPITRPFLSWEKMVAVGGMMLSWMSLRWTGVRARVDCDGKNKKKEEMVWKVEMRWMNIWQEEEEEEEERIITWTTLAAAFELCVRGRLVHQPSRHCKEEEEEEEEEDLEKRNPTKIHLRMSPLRLIEIGSGGVGAQHGEGKRGVGTSRVSRSLRRLRDVKDGFVSDCRFEIDEISRWLLRNCEASFAGNISRVFTSGSAPLKSGDSFGLSALSLRLRSSFFNSSRRFSFISLCRGKAYKRTKGNR
jgi:hypothetical protein